ncbi:MAG: chorismate mutase [Polyangiaceae bacterium]|nr:chorismate mutase [Polyangiaceae bacterium]
MLDDPELKKLRDAIDRLDHELLSVLKKRAEIVMRVGDLKRIKDLPVYDPAREEALFQRLAADAEAPLDAEAVRSVFREVVHNCRRLEEDHVDSLPEIQRP